MNQPISVERVRAWLAQAQPQHVIAVAAALLLLVFDTFIKSLSAVALGLIGLALSPWLITFMKTLELPGIKVEFRDQLEKVTERIGAAGLLSEPNRESQSKPAYEEVFNNDPTLALAGLRIALEQRLRDLLASTGLEKTRGSLGYLISRLRELGVLDAAQISAIADLMPLLNKAVHSEEYSQEGAGQWKLARNCWLLSTERSLREEGVE